MDIVVIGKACPICSSDVKGNAKMNYLCTKCNIIFRKNHLMNPDNLKSIVKEEDIKKDYHDL